MTDHEGKAREISSSSRCVNCQEISQYAGDPCCDYPMRITLITGDDLVAAIASASRRAEAGERERCVDYLMGQAMTLADRANSGTPVKVELLAAAGLVEDLANDFRAAAIRSTTDE